MKKSIFGLFLILASLIEGCSCTSIPSGHKGILWTAMNGTSQTVYSEGLEIVATWNEMVLYNTMSVDLGVADIDTLTSNGLSVGVDLSVRFRPKVDELVALHTEVGPLYGDIILLPTIRSVVREVVGRYTPEQLYSTAREKCAKEIFDLIVKGVEGKHIIVETVLLRDVNLPPTVKASIEDKLAEEQRALKMKYTLDREVAEAEKLRIEASGVAAANKIVTDSITPVLLKWEGIKATKDLAASPNAKVIVIGSNGSDGLPLFFGM